MNTRPRSASLGDPNSPGVDARLTVLGDDTFGTRIVSACGEALGGASIGTVQVNIGLRCNLACRHCHVRSSPKRTEEMDWPTMELVLEAVRRAGARTLDITGGAPEMNPNFRRLVSAARRQGVRVMVRTNLTIMLADGYEDSPQFAASEGVHLVASLPCYLKENVDRQRGLHVYEGSIEVIRRLNTVGYGGGDELPLDLVYNPGGATLPPPQERLEEDYRAQLRTRFGIEFRSLIAITNLPIGRFLSDLERQGRADAYEQLLRDAFNPDTIGGLMCRHQLHVGHDGTLHDCDFNYALGLPSRDERTGQPLTIGDFVPQRWLARRVVTANHCFGCTAGNGSSCGGAIVRRSSDNSGTSDGGCSGSNGETWKFNARTEAR